MHGSGSYIIIFHTRTRGVSDRADGLGCCAVQGLACFFDRVGRLRLLSLELLKAGDSSPGLGGVTQRLLSCKG